MADDKPKPIEKATLIFSIINMLFIGAGGYFLVGRQEAEMLQSSTRLNNIQAEISKVQLDVAKHSAQLDTLIKSATLAEKNIELLEAVRPKLDFVIVEKIERAKGYLTVTFELTNRGKYEISVHPTKLIISSKPYKSDLTTLEDKYIYSENLDIQQEDTVQLISPNEKRGHTLTVKLRNNTPSSAYYFMQYSAETRSDIVKIIDEMAQQQGVTSVVQSSKIIVGRYGKLIF